MMSAEVSAVAEIIRATLPLDREWQMMNSVPAPLGGAASLPGAPASYVEFLKVANGFICGEAVMFSAEHVLTMQHYTESAEEVPIQLEAGQWFCAGILTDDPWFISRADDSIWYYPDTGVVYWQSDRFEQAAPSLERFFVDVVCGPRYLTVSDSNEDDQWWRLLNQIGRA